VDVQREAQTSRSLLKRRAALVSDPGGTLAAAQGVMEEVEGVLQQVAELPHCTRRTDVDAIARKVDRKHLLMKIDLVSQELAAP
jgi:C4-type Zn-finger protein